MSALAQLCEEIIACRDCELAKYRTKVVPGEGAEDADLLFIGEAPCGTKTSKGVLSSDQQGNFWTNC